MNLTLQISDLNGESISFDLNEYALLQPQISVDIYKNKELQTNKTSEAVYQTFFFDLKEFSKKNTQFDLQKIAKIEWIFDQTKKGVVILDKVCMHKSLSQ